MSFLRAALLILLAVSYVASGQMDIYYSDYSIEQPSPYSMGRASEFTQTNEGFTPASGHYMPRNPQVSQTGSNEFRALIPNLLTGSGQSRSDGTSSPYANVGSSASTDSQAFLSFDISDIPKDAYIHSVALEFEGCDVVGTPFRSLGCLNIYAEPFRHFGSYSHSYSSTAASSPCARICSQDQLDYPLSSPSLTSALQDSLGQEKFQLYLQFDRRTASAGPSRSAASQSNTAGRRSSLGSGHSPGGYGSYTSGEYSSSSDWLGGTSVDRQTMQDMGLDIAFGQSDLVRNGESYNSGYVVLAPGINLSKLGITQEMLEMAIDPGQVKAASGPLYYEKASVKGVGYNNSDLAGSNKPAEVSLPEPEPWLDSEITREQPIFTYSRIQPVVEEENLFKIGVVWLDITYSLPPPVTPVIPQEKPPDLGICRFEPPEPSYLIDASSAGWGEVPANQVLVVIDSTLGFAEARDVARQLAAALRGRVVGEFEYINLFQIETSSRSLDELVRDVTTARTYRSIALAFPNQQVYLELESPFDDSVYRGENRKGYEITGVLEAWDQVQNSNVALSKVKVGITDDGLYRDYGEFDRTDINTSIKIYESASSSLLTSPVPGFETAGSHGTGVMNILTADPDDGGLVGIASRPLGGMLKIDMINIYVEKGDRRNIYVTTSLLGLKREIEDGCTILSCSWGSNHADPDTAEMFESFFAKLSNDYPSLLFVCSAGNGEPEGFEVDGTRRIPNGLPNGALPNVITVGNIMNNGELCMSSNRNKYNNFVTLAAPGEQAVWGMNNSGAVLNSGGGTSMATPHVTAAAALIRSIDPGLTAGEIKDILIKTGRDNVGGIDAPAELGGRILAIDRAVERAIAQRPAEVRMPPDTPAVVDIPADYNTEAEFGTETTYSRPTGFDATVTIRSAQFKGYDIEVDGSYIGTEGKGQDALDGVFTFTVAGNQQHLIRADHPLNWKRWQYFYNAGKSYDYGF